MPTIAANTDKWTTHQWTGRGDEWSPGGGHAGTDVLWWRTILPRIRTAVPARRVLEIGPGYGRWTEYLRTLCEHLVAVDVTPACIEACRERFAGSPQLEFHVNDGTSLPMVPDASIDFAFSFDSLVHAEGDVVDGYVQELARTLAPAGVAFLHHSNLGAFVDPRTQDVRHYVTRRNWRAPTMSARRLREACRRAGLRCATQELINWVGRGRHADRPRLEGRSLPLTDCLSIIRNEPSSPAHPTRVVANTSWVDEWRAAVWLATTYPPHGNGAAPPPEPVRTSVGRKLSTAAGLLQRGPSGFAQIARERAEKAGSAARAWTVGQVVKWKEPFVPALRAARCPDCGGQLSKGGRCRACEVEWVVA